MPAILLAAGASGLLIADPEVRSNVTAIIVRVMPPLRGLVDVIVEEAARDAAPVSIIGAVALLWGASRFVVAFENAIARIDGRGPKRGLFHQNFVAFGAVLAMIVAVVLGSLLAGAASFISAAQATGYLTVIGDAARTALDVAPAFLAFLALALVYRFLPLPSPAWRSLLVPSVASALAVVVLARLFVYFAPRFIGAAALLGTIATVFAALAWLGLSFQAVLIGAAWVRERDDARERAAVQARVGDGGVGQPP